jgi:UDP:flavonoid glycosyltransferase YjiC (YdhE family)
MVHHGGYGSCQMGLYTGTPAVIIPTFSERESNARRIADAGAGEYIVPSYDLQGSRHIDVSMFREKVIQVLEDPSYTENAERCSRELMKTGNPRRASQLIENFMASR